MTDMERIHNKLDRIFEEIHKELPRIPLIEQRLKTLEDLHDDMKKLAVLENTVKLMSIQVKTIWAIVLAAFAWLAQKFFGGLNGH